MSWSPARPFGTATNPKELLGIAIAVGSMGTLGFAVTSPILPDLADELGVSRGSIGLVQAAVSLPGVLFSAVIGYLADRTGRRRVILCALVLFTLCGMAGFVARSYWGLIGVRFCQGLGTSGILGVGIVLIGDSFTGDKRTRAMGVNVTGLMLASMIGPIVAGQLAGGGVFRPFLIFAIGVPLAAWASRMPPDSPIRTVPSPIRHLAASVRTMRAEQTLRDYLGLLVATLAGVFVMHGLGFTVTPLYLDDVFGTPVQTRGLVVAAFQVGTIVAALRVGWLLERLGTARMLTGLFSVMALGTAIAGLAPSAWAVAAGLTIAGVGFGLFNPQAQSFAAEVGGEQHRGLTVLMWVTVVRVAQFTGPPIGSMMADLAGPRAVFLVAAVAIAILAAAWRPVRRAIITRTPLHPEPAPTPPPEAEAEAEAEAEVSTSYMIHRYSGPMDSTVVRVGGYAPAGSVHSRALDRFAQALRRDAGDGIEVEVLYNVMDQGRPASDLLDMVASGELTWCYFSTSYLGSSVPALDALEVPFLFGSLVEAHQALDGTFGDVLSAATSAAWGYEVLGYWDNGFRHLTNAHRPVHHPDDVSGMSVRVQPNPIHEALFAAWGMTPVPTELSRGIALLAAGEVDAQENPLANSVAYGVDHPHITLTTHLYGARGLYANPEAMAALPPPLAAAVRRAARDAIRFQRRAAATYEHQLRATLEREGRQVVELTDEECDRFRQAASDVIAAARYRVGEDTFRLLDQNVNTGRRGQTWPS